MGEGNTVKMQDANEIYCMLGISVIKEKKARKWDIKYWEIVVERWSWKVSLKRYHLNKDQK